MACTPPLHSVENFRDCHCRWENDLTEEQKGMPVLCEVPLEAVNALAFGRPPSQAKKLRGGGGGKVGESGG